MPRLSSPTYAPWLGQAIAELVGRARGVLNVAGPEVLGRFAFAERVAAGLGLDATLLDPVATEALHQKARRPLEAGLRLERLRALGIEPRPLDEALADLAMRVRRGGSS